jgi:hypothetical protein
MMDRLNPKKDRYRFIGTTNTLPLIVMELLRQNIQAFKAKHYWNWLLKERNLYHVVEFMQNAQEHLVILKLSMPF